MLDFIDCNCMIGKRLSPREGSLENLDQFLDVMDRCDITQSIVYHSVAKEQYYLSGNELLEEEVGDNPRFLKQWVIVPNHTGEFMEPEELIAAMKENNVRTVRIFPKVYGFSVKPYVCGELFDTLAAHKVPVFIDTTQISWDDLYQMLQDYPTLRVVICDTGYDQIRFLYPVLKACPNLYVETSTHIVNDGIVDFVERFGAERMLFGTGLPSACATGAVTLLRYAEIPEEDKEKIAKGNILRMLEEVEL